MFYGESMYFCNPFYSVPVIKREEGEGDSERERVREREIVIRRERQRTKRVSKSGWILPNFNHIERGETVKVNPASEFYCLYTGNKSLYTIFCWLTPGQMACLLIQYKSLVIQYSIYILVKIRNYRLFHIQYKIGWFYQ